MSINQSNGTFQKNNVTKDDQPLKADNKKIKNKSKQVVGYMCTFEEGLCSDWLDAKGVMRENRKKYSKVAQAVKKDKLVNFKILAGPAPSIFTGPRVDHTTLSGRGKVLWMDAASMKQGEIAVAQTPPGWVIVKPSIVIHITNS